MPPATAEDPCGCAGVATATPVKTTVVQPSYTGALRWHHEKTPDRRLGDAPVGRLWQDNTSKVISTRDSQLTSCLLGGWQPATQVSKVTIPATNPQRSTLRRIRPVARMPARNRGPLALFEPIQRSLRAFCRDPRRVPRPNGGHRRFDTFSDKRTMPPGDSRRAPPAVEPCSAHNLQSLFPAHARESVRAPPLRPVPAD